MHRVGRNELETSIYVAIRTLPAVAKRALRSKLPHEGDAGTRALAARICDVIDNKSSMVISVDPVDAQPFGKSPGAFGVTEPDPCA